MGICCCGKLKDIHETLITNETMHEVLGKSGAFCGPVIHHRLRDAEDEIERLAGINKLAASLVADWDMRENIEHKMAEDLGLNEYYERGTVYGICAEELRNIIKGTK